MLLRTVMWPVFKERGKKRPDLERLGREVLYALGQKGTQVRTKKSQKSNLYNDLD